MSNTNLVKKLDLVDPNGNVISKQEPEQPSVGEQVMFQDFDIYQQIALSTLTTPKDRVLLECICGLQEELGELMSFLKRIYRGDYKAEDELQSAVLSLVKEGGDMLWYLAVLMSEFGIPFGEVPYVNMVKLKERHKNGMIQGRGDTRGEDDSVIEQEVQGE